MRLTVIHGYLIGFAVIGSWAVICFWSLALRLLGRYEDTPTFWRAVSVAQVLLAVQLLVGLVALALGGRPGRGAGGFTLLRHLNYGVLSPLVVLLFAHKFAHDRRWSPHTIFAVVGLVNFGLAGMAWMVGTGRL
ncbi:MAG: hypothetical protein ACRD0K_09385 [Egibacteraceae bacterium]